MKKATILNMVLTMAKSMAYDCDVQGVAKSVISDEFFDNTNEDAIKTLGQNVSINNGQWHIEYDEYNKSIWFYKTRVNSEGKATGYIPTHWIDITNLKQFEICGELGYYLMLVLKDMKFI